MSLASLLNRLVTLERPINVQDAVGGIVKQSWEEVVTDVPAAIQPLSGKDQQAFAQRQIFVTHRIYLDQDIAPHRSYRIRVTDPPTNQTFNIVNFYNQAGRDFLWSTDAKEQTA